MKRQIWKYILPVILLLAVLQVFPLIYTGYLSVHSWFLPMSQRPIYIGIENYVEAFRDHRFINTVKVQIIFSIATLSLEIGLALILALLLNQILKGRTFFRTILILPYMATPAAMMLIWKTMYDPSLGLLNKLLDPIYSLFTIEPIAWLGAKFSALASVILVSAWRWTPFSMLVLAATLQAIPKHLYEAAEVDGAGTLQKFRYVTLPHLRTAIAIILLFRGIDSLKTFEEIYVLTGGGPALATEITNILTYFKAFEGMHLGYASTLSMLILFISFSIAIVAIHQMRLK